MQNILTRWALTLAMVGLAALLALSTLLNVGHPLIVGSTDSAAPTAAAANENIPDSIPSEGQPGVSAERPTAALVIDARLSDSSTGSLLSALEKADKRATFFVAGVDISGNEDVLRRIADAGHEIGLGSFNRPRIGDLSAGDQLAQYKLTQRYVEGVTGQSPRFVRLPHSRDATSLSEAEVKAAENLQNAGFVTVFVDQVATSDRRELDGTSQVVLLGEPGQLDAVGATLELLDDEQYELDALSDYAGVASTTDIGFFRQFQSKTLVWSTGFQQYLRTALAILAVVVGIFLIGRYLFALLLVAGRRRFVRTKPESETATNPAVSVLIPAHNADQTLETTLSSIRRSDYSGTIEIIVIDDGSNDKTASVARQVPGVRVLSQTHSGRATAVNEGIRNASHDICILTYADAEFAPKTLARLVGPLSNPTVALVTGHALNRNGSWLRNLAAIERVSQFHINQRMEIMLGLGTEISGAATAVRRSALVDIGGVPDVTSAEDMDLTVALGVRGWDLRFEPTAPVSVGGETSLPALKKHLLDRRYGMLQVMWKHRKRHPGGNNSRYRLPALAYRLMTDFVIPLLTPLIDVFVLVSSLSGERYLLAAIWYSAMIIQLFTSWVAVLVSKVKDSAVAYSIPHFFLYRYLNFLVAARALFLVVDGRHASSEDKHTLGPGAPSANATVRPIAATGINR